jgi:hypothetical protein
MRAAAVILLLAVVALAGCSTTTPEAKDYTPTWARFFLESTDESAGKLALPVSGVRIAVGARPVLAENDFMNVELTQVELGKCLAFRLTPAAARDLYRLTGSNQGRRLVLMINGEALGARRIDGALADGVLFVFAEVPDASLPSLVQNLNRSAVALQKKEAGR